MVFVLSLLLRTNKVDKNIDIKRIVERYKKMIGYDDGRYLPIVQVTLHF